MLHRTIKRALNALSLSRYEPFNVIEISQENLLFNLRYFENKHPGQTVIPVLKSNAYGHGLKEVAKILEANGVKFLAVDGYFEAQTILDFTKCRVLVMGAIKPSNASMLDTKRCSFVIQDTDGLKAFAKLDKPVNIHIELNTGMNRLGLSEQEIDPYLAFFKKHSCLQLEGIMSHLADADSTKMDFTNQQSLYFEKVVKKILADGFNPKYIHLAQTAGSTKIQTSCVNALRLGIGLYGINPLQPNDKHHDDLNQLRPVLELKSAIIKTQNLEKGDRVSYNGIFTAPKAMRIGILPLGYYEGYPRDLSNKGITTYGNEKLPVVGRVCMNHTMIDLTASHADLGSTITLISTNKNAVNSVANICSDNQLFPYQLVSGLTEKIKRIIV